VVWCQLRFGNTKKHAAAMVAAAAAVDAKLLNGQNLPK
jgi:hypothetical protein